MAKLKKKQCPNCEDGKIMRKPAKEVLKPVSPFMENKILYVCSNFPECDTYIVDNHKKFVGLPANRELRRLRQRCHYCFDFLWKSGIMKDKPSVDARKFTYMWLAARLKITVKECHFGLFDKKQCRKAFRICGNYIYNNMDKIESFDYLNEEPEAKRIIKRLIFLKNRKSKG